MNTSDENLDQSISAYAREIEQQIKLQSAFSENLTQALRMVTRVARSSVKDDELVIEAFKRVRNKYHSNKLQEILRHEVRLDLEQQKQQKQAKAEELLRTVIDEGLIEDPFKTKRRYHVIIGLMIASALGVAAYAYIPSDAWPEILLCVVPLILIYGPGFLSK